MPGYRVTPLYGGAMACDLPANFADVRYAQAHAGTHRMWLTTTPPSKLRQVPDNQEVWIDKDGFSSIIFDITERVGSSGSGPEIDGRAMTTHLEDMVGPDIDTVKIWNTAETEFTRLECVAPGPLLYMPFRAYRQPTASKSLYIDS